MRALIALAAFAAVSLTSATGDVHAGGYRERGSGEVNNYTLSRRKPEVRGFLFRPGGHHYDYEYEPFLRRNGGYGNYPDFDPRTFSERVLSDPRTSTTSPSAF